MHKPCEGIIKWDEGQLIESDHNKVRAKGISLFWKTSTTATNALGGATIKFEAIWQPEFELSCD